MSNIMQTKYLIIGNSAAGIGAVEGIREVDPDGKILIVSDEPYTTYSRPLISYYLQGAVPTDQMYYRDDSFYEDNGCDIFFGPDAKVIDLDLEDKVAELGHGVQVNFDSCLIATGSVPFVPPMEGLENAKNAFTFTKYDDALGIEQVINEAEEPLDVVVLGAGLIGLKAVEALQGKVGSITVVDLAERILPSVLTESTAPVMQSHLEDQGISFRLGRSIQRVETKDGVQKAVLSDGEALKADLLILAAGTRPNTALIDDTIIEKGRGILTDTLQKTNVEDVYAAGDCTDSYDISTGMTRNIAILPGAYRQGHAAGVNMAGGEEVFTDGFPVNALGLLGFYMVSAGAYEGDEQIIVTEEDEKHLFVKDNQLKGFIIFGDAPRAGILTDLIRRKTDLIRVDAERIFESPGLAGFPKEYREEKLARVH